MNVFVKFHFCFLPFSSMFLKLLTLRSQFAYTVLFCEIYWILNNFDNDKYCHLSKGHVYFVCLCARTCVYVHMYLSVCHFWLATHSSRIHHLSAISQSKLTVDKISVVFFVKFACTKKTKDISAFVGLSFLNLFLCFLSDPPKHTLVFPRRSIILTC